MKIKYIGTVSKEAPLSKEDLLDIFETYGSTVVLFINQHPCKNEHDIEVYSTNEKEDN